VPAGRRPPTMKRKPAADGPMAPREVTLAINGRAYRGRVEPRKTLADFIREDCGLTGTHLGCEHGVCGACTILMNGDAVRSCLLFAVQAEGAELRTVEGLADGDRLGAPRAAVRILHAGVPDDRGRVPARPSSSNRTRDPRGPRRQPVPLHRLPKHCQGCCGRRRRANIYGTGGWNAPGGRQEGRPGASANSRTPTAAPRAQNGAVTAAGAR
jgi:2Fe-2S iron-sulfur cluster protein